MSSNLSTMVKSPAVMARVNEVLGQKANQFVASVLTLTNASPQLSKCDPKTILSAAMTAATLDLPINQNLGFAYIVPYKDQAQFQMGYKGFIQLAMRTGQYLTMGAMPINKEALTGYDEIGEPIVDFSLIDDSKPTYGYFFGFKMLNGFSKKAFWSKEKTENHAKRYSPAYKKGYSCPWKDNFDGMGQKTIIKNTLSKWGILSVEMQKAIESDQSVVRDDGGYDYVDNKQQSPLEQPLENLIPADLSQAEAQPIQPSTWPVDCPVTEQEYNDFCAQNKENSAVKHNNKNAIINAILDAKEA